MGMETSGKKNELDLALVYEHLVCNAFDCGRYGIWFADAGYYRARNESAQNRNRPNNVRIIRNRKTSGNDWRIIN